ncbi:MAG: outer membrane protein assembly factor BamA [Gammaproteobacteria bacterium]|jgi:outer membrane protein insertion porin family|nr:outer membrane protein assembly factor BamA [Gammaproteobacteria bacterium]NCX49055.1 outer membrane protein assembly factor BamA [Gammaproteobacteria bacterium]
MRCTLPLSAIALALAISAQAAEPFQASDIRIDGLKRVSSGSVFDALTIQPGDRVTDADISLATRALFETGFFDQVEVRADGDVLVIEVTERPAVSRIDIEGNQAIKTEDLLDSLRRAGIVEGDVLKRATLDQLEQAIQRQYTSRGRYDATVSSEIIEQDRNRVGLKISIFEGSVATISRIAIVGNEAFDDDTLLGEMSLTEAGLFTWFSGSNNYETEKLNADVEAIRSYYLNRGYVNVEVSEPQVELSENLEDVFITITVNEGKEFRVGSVNVGGDQPIDLSSAVEEMTLQTGEIFSRRLVNEAVSTMSKKLGDAGYARAQVRAVPEINDEKQTVDVTLVVTPGPLVYVRRVEFRGNTDTSDVVLRREIPQLEASVSSAAAIEKGKINLQRLGFFSLVRVSTRPVPDQPDQVDVVYEVKEQASGSLSASVGFSQGEGVLLGAAVSQKNFLGSGNALSFSLQSSSSTKEARFSFTDPYYTIDGVSRGIDLYLKQTDFDEEGTADYTTDDTGIGLSFGYPISDESRVSTNFAIQNVNLKTAASVPSYIGDFLTSEGISSSSREADFVEYKVGAAYSYDTLNKAFLPTAGTRHRVSFDLSIPGSDLEYYTASYLGETYVPVLDAEDVSLKFKTRLGYGDGFGDSAGLPFLKNFFAGGIRSVRGYTYNSLGPVDANGEQIGGNVLITGTAALQFPMPGVKETDQARLSLFTDAGQVYADNAELGDLRYSAGLALAWMTPIGPLSFTYAAALNSESTDETEGFQFSIGSTF